MTTPTAFDIKHEAPSFAQVGAVSASFGDFIVRPKSSAEGMSNGLLAVAAVAGAVAALLLTRGT